MLRLMALSAGHICEDWRIRNKKVAKLTDTWMREIRIRNLTPMQMNRLIFPHRCAIFNAVNLGIRNDVGTAVVKGCSPLCFSGVAPLRH